MLKSSKRSQLVEPDDGFDLSGEQILNSFVSSGTEVRASRSPNGQIQNSFSGRKTETETTERAAKRRKMRSPMKV